MQQLQKREENSCFLLPRHFFTCQYWQREERGRAKNVEERNKKGLPVFSTAHSRGFRGVKSKEKKGIRGFFRFLFFWETESRAQRKRKNFKGRKGGIE